LNVVVVVEDQLSAAVMQRLLAHVDRGFVINRLLVKRGIGNIRREMHIYRNASHVLPHIVVADLDALPCPVQARDEWKLTHLPARLMVRFAVRETEAWLLADKPGLAGFLQVPQTKLPSRPEAESDPKRCLVNLARTSKSRRLVAQLVPAQGSSVPIGPRYNELLEDFVRIHWDVDRAADGAPSLARMLMRLRTFPVS